MAAKWYTSYSKMEAQKQGRRTNVFFIIKQNPKPRSVIHYGRQTGTPINFLRKVQGAYSNRH